MHVDHGGEPIGCARRRRTRAPDCGADAVEPGSSRSGPESGRARPTGPPRERGAASIYTRHMETIDGVPVTDEMIQAWADEAERGYDVEALRARGITVSFTAPAPFTPSVSPRVRADP